MPARTPLERVAESTQTLYAELLDQEMRALVERSSRAVGRGQFVSKEIRGRRYWYVQNAIGDRRVQTYVGPESPVLLRQIEGARLARADLERDARPRGLLAQMLVRGGMPREPATTAAVLALLADLGLFGRGATLVGTQAFRAYGPLLGVRLEGDFARTQDIDVAHDLDLTLAVSLSTSTEGAGGHRSLAVGDRLVDAGLELLPVPGLDPRQASTSFKVRGRDLRVDFLVPVHARAHAHAKARVRSNSTKGPLERQYGAAHALAAVPIPGLGVAGQPLPFLDYLLEETTPALLFGPSRAILVTVPDPARFALHKLWTAVERPVSETAKARKDRRQAAALLAVLAADRPQDIERALEEAKRWPRQRPRLAKELERARREGLPLR